MREFDFKSTSDKREITVSGFLGVDFTSGKEDMDLRRSMDAPNMIRDTPEKNKKRNGYFLTHTFSGEINGIHTLTVDGEERFLVHAGTELYLKNSDGYTSIYSSMNDARSSSAVLAGKLIILDGAAMLSYNGTTVKNISQDAYVPTVVIGRSPRGGGTLYEPINMITGYRIDKFTADGNSVRYYVSSGACDTINYIKRRLGNGEWEYMSLFVHYDYNASGGYVEFYEPPLAPTDGEDNILICYTKYNFDYQSTIFSCNICTLYGINGSLDRIFITGSDKYPSRDYYCQLEDPTYWGDTWYCNVGKSDTKIVGYSLVANSLATHKAGEESQANIILRSGVIIDDEPCFPITGTYTAGGAVAADSFGILDNEPVYLSYDGISAITPSDVLGERSSQVRSYYLNGRLLKEQNPENASAVSYKGFYMLLLNGHIYILDGLQSVLENGKPFSHRQYEGYYWDNIPAKFLFTDNTYLYFAGEGGKLYRFYTDEEELYTDDGNEYEAYWETAFFSGNDFAKLKTVTHISLLLDGNADKVMVEYKDSSGNYTLVAQGDENDNAVLSKRIHIKDCSGMQFRIKSQLSSGLKICKIQIAYINGKSIK